MELSRIIVTCSLIVGTGVILDRVILKRHKIWLYDKLYILWLQIDRHSIPQLPRVLARSLLKLMKPEGQKVSQYVRLFFIAVIVSCLLTYLSITLSKYDILEVDPNLVEVLKEMQREGVIPSDIDYDSPTIGFSMAARTILFDRNPYGIFIINFIFDSLTIVVTYHILQLMQKCRPRFIPALIAIDLAVAFILAITCIYTFITLYPEQEIVSYVDPDRVLISQAQKIEYSFRQAVYPLKRLARINTNTSAQFTALVDSDLAYYGVTSFLPTAFFMFMCFAAFLGWFVLKTAKSLTLFTIERATEDPAEQLQIFTLTTSWLALLTLILNWISRVFFD